MAQILLQAHLRSGKDENPTYHTFSAPYTPLMLPQKMYTSTWEDPVLLKLRPQNWRLLRMRHLFLRDSISWANLVSR
jgi:hypothetical protein